MTFTTSVILAPGWVRRRASLTFARHAGRCEPLLASACSLRHAAHTRAVVCTCKGMTSGGRGRRKSSTPRWRPLGFQVQAAFEAQLAQRQPPEVLHRVGQAKDDLIRISREAQTGDLVIRGE